MYFWKEENNLDKDIPDGLEQGYDNSSSGIGIRDRANIQLSATTWIILCFLCMRPTYSCKEGSQDFVLISVVQCCNHIVLPWTDYVSVILLGGM